MISSYESVIAASERVAWKIDDVIPRNGALDFTKRFLPDALVGADQLEFLAATEKLKLNQIRGNAYAHIFQFVEEYIVATCVRHVEAEVFGDEMNLRAMLRFAEEEVKHQMLFQRFLQIFEKGFGSPCEGIPSQKAVAGIILSKTPMAVMMITLHLEVMTQQHYTQCVQSAEGIDPLFRQMLKSHWAEESQHAKIDAMTLRKLALTSTVELRQQAVQDYLDLVDALLGLLGQQAELDVKSFERALGKSFSEEHRAQLLSGQKRSYRQTFVTWGITNPLFLDTVSEVFPEDAVRIKARAAELSAA